MKKLSVLVAEDDELIERITLFYLQKIGHAVDVAKNGREAVECFRKKAYDIILMDIQMPEMDGLQAVAEIRNIEKRQGKTGHTRIIATTTSPNREECLKAGADGYARKPFSFEEFQQIFHPLHQI